MRNSVDTENVMERSRTQDQDGFLSTALRSRMSELGISILDLADRCEASYEHMRKLVRNEARPSVLMLKQICEALQLDREEMNELAVADNIRHRYGDIPEKLAGKDPRLANLERIIPDLDDRQIADLEQIARSMAKAKKHRR